MSYVEGTYLGELIDRTVDNWAILLGFADGERSRNADGTFVGDNPDTDEVNEAWLTGKSPKKKKTSKKKKN